MKIEFSLDGKKEIDCISLKGKSDEIKVFIVRGAYQQYHNGILYYIIAFDLPYYMDRNYRLFSLNEDRVGWVETNTDLSLLDIEFVDPSAILSIEKYFEIEIEKII